MNYLVHGNALHPAPRHEVSLKRSEVIPPAPREDEPPSAVRARRRSLPHILAVLLARHSRSGPPGPRGRACAGRGVSPLAGGATCRLSARSCGRAPASWPADGRRAAPEAAAGAGSVPDRDSTTFGGDSAPRPAWSHPTLYVNRRGRQLGLMQSAHRGMSQMEEQTPEVRAALGHASTPVDARRVLAGT